jgi:hypothetical protein
VRGLDGKNSAVFFVMGENALAKMKYLVGENMDPKEALLKYHQSLRALYGQDSMRNGFIYGTCPDTTLKVSILITFDKL